MNESPKLIKTIKNIVDNKGRTTTISVPVPKLHKNKQTID